MALVDLILRLQKGEPLTSQEMDDNLSNLLAGIVQSSCDWAGSQEPEETFPYLRWIDTSTNPPTNKIRNAEDDDWITLGSATTPLGTAATLDVGTEPNEIPTNDDLGSAAYINHEDLPISTATQAALETKVDKVEGKNLSTEDYTSADKAKLQGIEAGAQVNTVTSVAGKTGAVVLAKSDVGLSNVDNTSDMDKPVSTAQATALAGKANVSHTHTVGQVTGLGNSATRDVGTSSGTVAAGNDSRITGAAQKSANLSDLTNSSTARTNLGLGTAATRDVTVDSADVTAGRLLKVGDLGSNKRPTAVVDFNDLPDLYPYSGAVPVLSNAGSTNKPPKDTYYYVEQHFYSSNGNVTQIAIPYRVDSDGLWMRSRYQGTWSPWREIYHSGNLPAIDWNSLTGKPSTFPPSSHTHTVGQVTGLGNAATRNITTSTADPSGGTDGDIWLLVE